jgi:hypothetical protein
LVDIRGKTLMLGHRRGVENGIAKNQRQQRHWDADEHRAKYSPSEY